MSYKWKLEEVEAINRRRAKGDHGNAETLLRPEPQELDWVGMEKHLAIKADWTTPEILIEGSLNSAKTTLALDREIDALVEWPGIPIFIFRWTQDSLDTKLKPPFEQLLLLRGFAPHVDYEWDRDARAYIFTNGSKVFAFGLKAASFIEKMNKLRGLGVCRIMGDQIEEAERDVIEELRGRLRPDLTATLTGRAFPFQLTLVANPSDATFWLSRQFPTDNRVKGRRLYGGLSIYDNKYLPASTLESLERTWPEGHPKHQTMILGLRGLNITGDPIYEGLYDRAIHARPVVAGTQLLEAYEIGKFNPCWVVAQKTYHGALQLVGGILGQQLALEDFLRIVKRTRAEWFPTATFQTTASPVGERESQAGRLTLLDVLREWQVRPIWRESANLPDVILMCIEELSSYLRRRTPSGKEESFCVNTDPDRWLVASREEITPQPFMSFAFEGGAVWDPELVSVSHKRIKQMSEDDHYANAMRCVELLLLSFFVRQPSEAERVQRRQRELQDQETHHALVDFGPNSWLAY